MAKQNEVTAASMVRRARAHVAKAKEHRGYAREFKLSPAVQQMHLGIATGHEESAAILRDEAKEIRSHR